jgi:hypothetical protein
MSYKNKRPENPVGPDAATFEFRYSLWQVLAALLVVAIVLTAWKVYEARFIAPNIPVAWQAFSEKSFDQARRQGRDVLLQVVPVERELAVRQIGVTSRPEFQRAVFLASPVALQIDLNEELDEGTRNWLPINVPAIAAGGMAFFPQHGSAVPRCIAPGELSIPAAVALMDGE